METDLVVGQFGNGIGKYRVGFVEDDGHVVPRWSSDIRMAAFLEGPVCVFYLRLIGRAVDAE